MTNVRRDLASFKFQHGVTHLTWTSSSIEASAWKISIHRAVSDATGFVLTFENQHRSDDDYLVKAQKELNSIEFTDLHNLSSHGE
ncbi:hypothetical protein HO133_006846 [Letharia lupina]|uniref:Uncharacterized protein n=1 Tax=Letharia lupina TaxID=560253 RepID=A0A8H6C601_9LECA|nr:uncharacterized protein HO133_006846 [Letharia lupina]KAF6217508.1 hypothetical protein HO133_006846 [Letharia lupina]